MADMFENRRYRRLLLTGRRTLHLALLLLIAESSLWATHTARPIVELAGCLTVAAVVVMFLGFAGAHRMDCPTTERRGFSKVTWLLLVLTALTWMAIGIAKPEHWYVAMFGCILLVWEWFAYTCVRKLRLEYGQSQIAQSAGHRGEGV